MEKPICWSRVHVFRRHGKYVENIWTKHGKYVEKIFISTDSKDIRKIGEQNGAIYIKRPSELCTDVALGDDAFRHGYYWIKENIQSDIELIVLLFCNSVCVTNKLIEKGIEILQNDIELDSVVTVSKYNMWSPLRARKINNMNLLEPFMPFEVIGDPNTLSCDRDSQGDVWFADMGLTIVRPRCFENMENGMLPQKYMGNKIYPLKQEAGFDIDYEWQLPMVEFWLKKYGGY